MYVLTYIYAHNIITSVFRNLIDYVADSFTVAPVQVGQVLIVRGRVPGISRACLHRTRPAPYPIGISRSGKIKCRARYVRPAADFREALMCKFPENFSLATAQCRLIKRRVRPAVPPDEGARSRELSKEPGRSLDARLSAAAGT